MMRSDVAGFTRHSDRSIRRFPRSWPSVLAPTEQGVEDPSPHLPPTSSLTPPRTPPIPVVPQLESQTLVLTP